MRRTAGIIVLTLIVAGSPDLSAQAARSPADGLAGPGGHAAGRLEPLPGPQLLYTVPANAFPTLHGFGDRRFGVVQAYEAANRADDLHVGWERVQIRWDLLQPTGPLDWNSAATQNDQPYDREIAAGHELVGVIEGIPAWAAQDPREGGAAVPRNFDLPWNDPRNYWGQFVFRAARHYAGRIDTLIILNEVSIATGPYRQFAGTPAQYAQMLRVAYLAAHAANPHVEVHSYGDSVYADYGVWFREVVNTLAGFPDARANNFFFDAAEVHLYESVLRWDALIPVWHAAMLAHGFDHPIWMSETNVAPRDDYAGLAPPTDHNTVLANQPSFIIDSFAAALGLGMAREEIYLMRDPVHIAVEKPLGLVRRDGTVRPEYMAFKTANSWFAGVFATRYEPCATPFVSKVCVFRVTMERPGQEIQVLWNQGGLPANALVPSVAPTATVVQPSGSATVLRTVGGQFTLHLDAATDQKIENPLERSILKISSVPLIVVQDLPPGQDVPGLKPLFVERDRGAGVDSRSLGPVAGMAIAPDGSDTRAIADTAHDRVLVEDGHGRVTTIIGDTGGAPGQFRGPAGVAIGADGTLYVADKGNARIQEFDLRGRLLGGFGSYDAGNASLHAPTALAVAPDGALYVVDAAQDVVLRFSRMGRFLGRFGGPGYGIGQLDGPGGIAVDASGTIYVADTLNNRVQEFDSLGKALGQIGSGTAGAGNVSLHWPVDVTALPGRGIAITDADNGRVVAVNPNTFLGSFDLGNVVTPGGLAIAADGSYYVSDASANRVVHLDAIGQQLVAFGSSGFGPSQLRSPLGLALDTRGDIVVADAANNRLDIFRPDGRFVRSIGGEGHRPGQFLGPSAISVASDGTLWVADTFNARVQHLTDTGVPLGAPIANVNGAWGVAADNHGGVFYSARWGQHFYHRARGGVQQMWGAPGTGPGEFDQPTALAATRDGATLYVVDSGNARVQIMTGGQVTAQRGSAAAGPSGLTRPVAVAVAPGGSIAVLDAARRRIVRYQGVSAGSFTSIRVTGVPLGLAVDTRGELFAVVCGPWTGAGAELPLHTPVAIGAD